MTAPKKDDPNAATCIKCWFFTVAAFGAAQCGPEPEPIIGECHRYPPPHRHHLPNGKVDNVSYFPFVNDDDWCGEWKQGAEHG